VQTGKESKDGFYGMLDPKIINHPELWKRAEGKAKKYKGSGLYNGVVSTLYKKLGGTFESSSEGDDDTDNGASHTTPEVPEDSWEAVAQRCLLENPEISAATLINVTKSKMATPAPKDTDKTDEADSASSLSQTTRPKESSKIFFKTSKLRERAASDDGIGITKFEAVLIEEGMGNFTDAFYYSREAIESSVTIFEGRKIYADHPAASEDTERPERSVRDILGHFENVRVEENEGRAMLVGDVTIMDEKGYAWARGLMRHAIEYAKKFPDKEFVGLSINASGEASEESLDSVLNSDTVPDSAKGKLNEAKEFGIDVLRVVRRIIDAVSCDLVTEAGAGGKVLKLIEEETGGKGMKKRKTTKEAATKKKPVLNLKEQDEQPHSDVDQDIELIKKLMDQYSDMDEGERGAMEGYMKQSLAMAKEMGFDGEKAQEMADFGAKVMQQACKDAAESAEAEEEEKPEDKEDKSEESADSDDAEKTEEAGDDKEDKEDAKESMIQLKGRVAFLENELKAKKLVEHLDKFLKGTGESTKVTKAFREAISIKKDGDTMLDVRDEKDLERKWNLFCKGLESRGKSGFEGFVINTEKAPTVSGKGNGKLNLSDCASE